MKWIKTKDNLPCKEGEQSTVLFCSPGGAIAMSGLFTNFGDYVEWSIYDQQNDRYYLLENTVPALWMYMPKVPNDHVSDTA